MQEALSFYSLFQVSSYNLNLKHLYFVFLSFPVETWFPSYVLSDRKSVLGIIGSVK